jgi:AcrR family transcriptional regulator
MFMQEIDLESPPARRPRNDKRRARNREALIGAALELTTEQGAAALTPAAIARRAGLHKQAFYVHFKGLDECVAALALRVGSESRAASELRHAELVRQPVRDRPAEVHELSEQLRFVRAHADAVRLLASERYAEGPVGAAVRETIRRSRRLWTEALLEVALRNGLTASSLGGIETLAHVVVDMALATSMRVLEDPSLSIEAEAERGVRYAESLITRELRHLYREQRSRA